MKDLERKLMLERERARISRDMHDDVGASLSRISMLSEIVKNNVEGPDNIKSWLGQISDISRDVIDEMNQIIWALNPRNDTLDGLVVFIRRFAMEYFEASQVRCRIVLPETIPDVSLGVEIRRNIYLVVREALHNTFKHAGAHEVEIALEVIDKGFKIMIRDNGKGFDPEKLNYQGNGLNNMKKRMNEIGGEFFLHSEPGIGTEIILVM
jgi:signal transduction histidine kinase